MLDVSIDSTMDHVTGNGPMFDSGPEVVFHFDS